MEHVSPPRCRVVMGWSAPPHPLLVTCSAHSSAACVFPGSRGVVCGVYWIIFYLEDSLMQNPCELVVMEHRRGGWSLPNDAVCRVTLKICDPFVWMASCRCVETWNGGWLEAFVVSATNSRAVRSVSVFHERQFHRLTLSVNLGEFQGGNIW